MNTVLDRSKRIQCRACKEWPIWTDNICGVCNAKRIVKHRKSVKRDAINRLIAELAAEGEPT
jgi:DNA-directed RNA polymerase subunit RPC12/RpoP